MDNIEKARKTIAELEISLFKKSMNFANLYDEQNILKEILEKEIKELKQENNKNKQLYKEHTKLKKRTNKMKYVYTQDGQDILDFEYKDITTIINFIDENGKEQKHSIYCWCNVNVSNYENMINIDHEDCIISVGDDGDYPEDVNLKFMPKTNIHIQNLITPYERNQAEQAGYIKITKRITKEQYENE